MARNIEEILQELFRGQDSALAKYARVRKTKYEFDLYRSYGLPLSEVGKVEKLYFSKKFLGGKRITNVSPEEFNKGIASLDHAVKDGCHGRCLRLITELNGALAESGFEQVKNPERFLDWLTFDYEVKKDSFTGEIAKEQPYGFEIRVFHSEENRKEFWMELQILEKNNMMMCMQDVAKIVLFKRHHSKKSQKPEGSI